MRTIGEDLRLRVEGMDCPSCARKIEAAVGRIAGVTAVAVNVGAGTVRVAAVAPAPADDVLRTIRTLGYATALDEGTGNRPPAAHTHSHDGHDDHHHGHHHGHDHGHDHGDGAADRGRAWWRTGRGRLVIASGLVLAAALAADHLWPALGPWPFVLATLVGLVPVARRAAGAVATGQVFTIEALMTVAALGALAIDAAEEAAVVVFLFAVGELLEGVAAGRAHRSITALAGLAPKTARLLEAGLHRDVPAADLVPGQVVLVRAGERIPCDGRIAEGQSEVDESPVTGESVPRPRAAGDPVFAGSVNGGGTLQVVVTRAAADNTIARIARLVGEAQASRAPVERFIDRFARIYMPAVVAVATLVAVGPPLAAGEPWDVWLYRALALLLIACPCALVISTPAAIAAGLAAGARHGLLMKGGAVLETVGRLRTVAFDKTGTLTLGRPVVTRVVGLAVDPATVLRLAAALEAGSSHPIARAVLEKAAAEGLAPALATDVATAAGRGLSGLVGGARLTLADPRTAADTLTGDAARQVRELEEAGATVAVLHGAAGALGLIAVRDEARPDARDGLARLAALGVGAVMLTGDNARAAAAIGQGLGIAVRAELMPEDKVRIVRELGAASGPVGKVGDGINDAPALAAAAVGIAMGSGTDVAIETADAALLRNRVGDVARLVRLSRATMANVRANVVLALGSKAVFLVTTIAGVTGMWIAVLADTGATVLVTLNALRLLRLRLDP